jgi:hypothetical protein
VRRARATQVKLLASLAGGLQKYAALSDAPAAGGAGGGDAAGGAGGGDAAGGAGGGDAAGGAGSAAPVGTRGARRERAASGAAAGEAVRMLLAPEGNYMQEARPRPAGLAAIRGREWASVR